MANKLQVLRGLEINRSGQTPEEGQFLYTTDEKKVYIGDGSTAGGIILPDTTYEEATATTGGLLTDGMAVKLESIEAVIKTEFTTANGQTEFTVEYIVDSIDVLLNGIELAVGDFTATNETSVTIPTANENDIVVVKSYSSVAIEDSASISSANTFTAAQRTSTSSEDNHISFDSNNNFTLTADIAENITVLNQTTGQSGTIIITDSENIIGWGTEFDWGNAGVPTDLTGVETFAYYISGSSGTDSIKIGRL